MNYVRENRTSPQEAESLRSGWGSGGKRGVLHWNAEVQFVWHSDDFGQHGAQSKRDCQKRRRRICPVGVHSARMLRVFRHDWRVRSLRDGTESEDGPNGAKLNPSREGCDLNASVHKPYIYLERFRDSSSDMDYDYMKSVTQSIHMGALYLYYEMYTDKWREKVVLTIDLPKKKILRSSLP